jgi:hypothetical protein
MTREKRKNNNISNNFYKYQHFEETCEYLENFNSKNSLILFIFTQLSFKYTLLQEFFDFIYFYPVKF